MGSRIDFKRAMGRALAGVAALGLGAVLGHTTDWGRPSSPTQRQPSRAHATSEPTPKGNRTTRNHASSAVQRLLEAEATALPEIDGPVRAPNDGLGASFRDGKIMTGRTPHRLILFTFDDGPDRTTTPPLLDRLDAAGVRAVFFLTGRRLRGNTAAEREQQEIARETVRRGHLVASHTFTHQQLPLLDDTEALREIAATEQIFKRVLGGRPWLFRPPGGAHSPRIDRLIASRGYTTVLWNLGAGDFQVRTAEDVYETWKRVFERRQREGDRGGIVLLHDTYEWSVHAFDLIMDHLMSANCKLLEKGEELYDIVDDPRYFFAPRGQAGASAEAPPATVADAILQERQARLRHETTQRCNSLAMR